MPDRRFSAQPLYVQLREALTERIASGVWSAGDALPNEVELAREFGLSAGTVRKALDWMEQARLVSRQQGRGTFVVDQSSDELAARFENICKPDGSSVAPEVIETSVSEAEASPPECRRLELHPGARVYRIRQKQLLASVPLLLETVVLPVSLFSAQRPENGTPYNIVALAKACGVLLGKGEERVRLGHASQDVAQALAIDAGDRIIELERVINTIDGRPAELRLASCNLGENYYSATLGV